MQRRLCILFALLFVLYGCASSSTSTSSQPDTAYGISSIPGLHLPPGFQISVYASGLHAPRFTTIGPNDVLLVSDRASNSIIALPPGTSTSHAGEPIVVARNLKDPTSLVMHSGYLYVGEGSSIARM